MTTPFSSSPDLEPETGFVPSPSLGKAANELRSAASEKARELVHTAESKAAVLKERALESAQQFRETANQKATALKSCATEQWDDTRVKAKELHVTAEDYIRQNPTKCVLSALGIGFLIGLIVRR
jgi:ElaB/YqjD/DUF883 family membrane-anchored ribosome-binding protein